MVFRGASIFLFSVIACLATTCSVASAAPPTAPALLDGLEAASTFQTPFSARIEVLHEGAWHPPEGKQVVIPTVRRRTWSDVHYDGRLLGVETRDYDEADADVRQPQGQRIRTVLGDGACTQFVEAGGDGDHGPLDARRYAWKDGDRGANNAHAVWGLELLGMAHGTRQGLASLLRDNPEVSVRNEMESVQGHACYVLESAAADQRWSVWLDPAAGGLPRRIQGSWEEKNPETVRRNLDALATPVPAPLSGPAACRYELDDVFIGEAAGRPFLQRARVNKNIRLASGNSYQTSDRLLMCSLQFGQNPEAAAFLSMDDLPQTGVAAFARTAPDEFLSQFGFEFAIEPTPKLAGANLPPPRSALQRLGWVLSHLSVARLRETDPRILIAISAALAVLVNAAVGFSSRRRAANPDSGGRPGAVQSRHGHGARGA